MSCLALVGLASVSLLANGAVGSVSFMCLCYNVETRTYAEGTAVETLTPEVLTANRAKPGTLPVTSALERVEVEIACDGRKTVSMPLGAFFGTGPWERSPFRTRVAGVEKSGARETRRSGWTGNGSRRSSGRVRRITSTMRGVVPSRSPGHSAPNRPARATWPSARAPTSGGGRWMRCRFRNRCALTWSFGIGTRPARSTTTRSHGVI